MVIEHQMTGFDVIELLRYELGKVSVSPNIRDCYQILATRKF